MVLPGTITPALVQEVSEPCPARDAPGMYFQCIYSALDLCFGRSGLHCPLLQSIPVAVPSQGKAPAPMSEGSHSGSWLIFCPHLTLSCSLPLGSIPLSLPSAQDSVSWA